MVLVLKQALAGGAGKVRAVEAICLRHVARGQSRVAIVFEVLHVQCVACDILLRELTLLRCLTRETPRCLRRAGPRETIRMRKLWTHSPSYLRSPYHADTFLGML